VEASPARRTVVLSGTIAALSAAFGVYLANYEHAGGAFRGRTGPIFVPEDLDGIVQGVFGFDNRPQARPHFRHHKLSPKPNRCGPARSPLHAPPGGRNSTISRPDCHGAGECIGILEFGGGYTTTT
jgi:kumamolisin